MSDEYDSGTSALIADLEAKPRTYDRDEILSRARKLRYHSFSDVGYDAPEITLIKHLKAAGFKDLIDNVAAGKYEQPAEESRRWAEETPEGREAMAMAERPEVQEALNGILDMASKLTPEQTRALAHSLGAEKPWKKS